MNEIGHRKGRAARCALAIGMLTAMVLMPRPAAAQAATPPPPPPVREGSAEFAFVGTSGNASTQTLGLGGELIYRPAPWVTRFKTAFVRNEAEDTLRAQAFVATLRAERPVADRLSAYGQYGYQRDTFAGILHRHAGEGGLAYRLIEQDRQALTVDAGLGYANERRLAGPSLSTATLGTGSSYTLKLSETSAFTDEGRFVFALDDRSDWRFGNTAALTASLTSLLSLKLSNSIRHLNLPVAGFERTDVLTSVALVAKF